MAEKDELGITGITVKKKDPPRPCSPFEWARHGYQFEFCFNLD